jgi:uncharacterized protein (TIGR03435 family)
MNLPLAFLGFAVACCAQSRLEFDVASVRVNQDGIGGAIIRTPGGLNATNAPFDLLLQMAFQTRMIDLSGVPASLRAERFDIAAKAADKISGDQYWQMLQALLEDRFKLRHHRETKDADVFALATKGAGCLASA